MLTASEKALLDVVLKTADDDAKRIRTGVEKALRGIHDQARRTHLWDILTKAARKKIRESRRVVQYRLPGI